jgi:hypothetical protein
LPAKLPLNDPDARPKKLPLNDPDNCASATLFVNLPRKLPEKLPDNSAVGSKLRGPSILIVTF